MRIVILASVFALATACAKEEKKKETAKGAVAGKGSDAGTGTGSDAAGGSGNVEGDAFYTGFDGQTDYSILLPSFSTYTLKDPTIAKIEEKKFTLSEETIESLIEEATKENPDFDA